MYARTLLVGLMVCGMAANAGAQPRDASGNEWASGSNLAAGPDVVRPSYHQALLEAHRDTPVNRDLIDGPVQVPQVRGATSNPCSIVFGYLPYWESSANIQWNRLTHLGAFSIQINSAGNVTNAHGWPWTSLVNTAHANGVKVHLVVTLFDGAAIQTLINSPANKANFFENMRDLMIAGNADGINIDFESGSGWQGQMDEFMGELSAYMDAEIPGSETSIATAPVNWGNAWQFGNLVQNTDIIFIMGYAFAGSWSSTTGAGAPRLPGARSTSPTRWWTNIPPHAPSPRRRLYLGCPLLRPALDQTPDPATVTPGQPVIGLGRIAALSRRPAGVLDLRRSVGRSLADPVVSLPGGFDVASGVVRQRGQPAPQV
jgi:hypothetical protein